MPQNYLHLLYHFFLQPKTCQRLLLGQFCHLLNENNLILHDVSYWEVSPIWIWIWNNRHSFVESKRYLILRQPANRQNATECCSRLHLQLHFLQRPHIFLARISDLLIYNVLGLPPLVLERYLGFKKTRIFLIKFNFKFLSFT